MGNTGGTGGVGGELGGGGGGGGGGGFFGGRGGKGGTGYQSECTSTIDSAIKDSEDTIFIWVEDNFDGKSFIDYAEKAGKIKTDRNTAFRMAALRTTEKSESTREGIVTYEQKLDVRKALNIFEGLQSTGQVVKVQSAGDFLKKKDIKDCYFTKQPGENTAWTYWRWKIDKHQPRGGQGGQGGSGFWGWFSGQDGQSGGSGPGGQGGKGGKGGGF